MSSALIHMPYHTARNRSAWLSIAAFLDRDPSRDLTDHARKIAALAAQRPEGAPLAGEASGRGAHPVGNHGDNDLRHRPPASGEAR